MQFKEVYKEIYICCNTDSTKAEFIKKDYKIDISKRIPWLPRKFAQSDNVSINRYHRTRLILYLD